ncbi:MAG: hypothetical protein KC502_03095 [Myxococcales bacterium]|nr:hypothetical protein [Myxococcales bacterium]
MVVSIRTLAAGLLIASMVGCSNQVGLPAYEGAGLRYPVALTADQSGKFVYVVGANFDRAHRSGLVRVIDTVAGTWVDGAPVEIPTYAANVTLQSDALGAGKHRLFVPAREDDSISIIDVDTSGPGAPSLNCGQDKSGSGSCADAWRIGGPNKSDLDLGQDPMAVSVTPGHSGQDALVHVAAAVGGRISTFGVKTHKDGGVTATALPTLVPAGTANSSLSALVRSPIDGRMYVSDVRRGALFSYDLNAETSESETTWSIEQHAGIALPAAGSEMGRSMALSADAGRLFVAYRSPNALLIVDTAPDVSGEPANAHVDTIGLGGSPAQVVLAPTGPGGRELAYVSCFGTDDIWVVDPVARSVVSVIRLPHSPYGLAVANVPGRGWTLYTGLFSQHRVAVIDLDEGDKQRHEVSGFIQ